MNESSDQYRVRWRAIVRRVSTEMERLGTQDRHWMSTRLAEIASIQNRMQAHFLRADGREECARCDGQCCDRGRNHFTLVNLLGYLLQGQNPPEPDFDLPCPFLEESGCRLDFARRPFACISFVCGNIEAKMSPADRAAFYGDESRLRLLYEQFDGRYALSSSRGILIRSVRLGDEPFLVPVRKGNENVSGTGARRFQGDHP
ncbi:MAG: hypothetical protein R6V08_02050 [Desulfuromonadales bacterium]